MRDVAVVGFAESPHTFATPGTSNGVEMLVPIFAEVLGKTGLSKADVDFWCSGSSDYLAGRAFSFVSAVDAIGAYPPINESHVEMDAAWALYEAWLKILTGEVDTALVYGFGKASAGDPRRVLALQLDPYVVAPLWPDPDSLAGLQHRMGLEAGLWSEPLTPVPFADGASVVVLASGDRAGDLCDRPAWITRIEHRVDAQLRHWLDVPSARFEVGDVEIAEVHAPYRHQEILLARELGLGDGVAVNGLREGNPMFAAGLARIGTAATHIHDGRANRVLAHASSGPLLQQNLVCILEAR
ncbi:lipid-transfer protein [Allorhizocola rhizosphaerae]|uniref:lipid-transfer protein n=1 Tax=Allorhizocola rhizosphaerae TaxID=1872709 RepID=UPI000E3E403A|nr:lipid-transfer protein [Allorhizocola rhizosphaerae]